MNKSLKYLFTQLFLYLTIYFLAWVLTIVYFKHLETKTKNQTIDNFVELSFSEKYYSLLRSESISPLQQCPATIIERTCHQLPYDNSYINRSNITPPSLYNLFDQIVILTNNLTLYQPSNSYIKVNSSTLHFYLPSLTYSNKIDSPLTKNILTGERTIKENPNLHINSRIHNTKKMQPSLYSEYIYIKPKRNEEDLILIHCMIIISLITIGIIARAVIDTVYDVFFSIDAKFKYALMANKLRVEYQPIVNIETGICTGAETLLRWTHNGSNISADVLISVAVKNRLIPQLTRWICSRAVLDFSQYMQSIEGFYITINLSAEDITDTDFPNFISSLITRHCIPSSSIVFEITEGLSCDESALKLQMTALADSGHLIAIDDFGTGQSNFSRIDDLPIRIIKLDKSFMHKIKTNPTQKALMQLIYLAETLELTIVAEGVETIEHLNFIHASGLKYAQGWYYSKSMPPSMFQGGIIFSDFLSATTDRKNANFSSIEEPKSS